MYLVIGFCARVFPPEEATRQQRNGRSPIIHLFSQAVLFARSSAHRHMERSDSIGRDAKYHVYIEERRFLGTLCCKAEDVVDTGAVLRGELYIKVKGSVCVCSFPGRRASSSATLNLARVLPQILCIFPPLFSVLPIVVTPNFLSVFSNVQTVQSFDTRTVEERHRKIPMFPQRKEKFASQQDRDAFNKMMTGFRVFLESLRQGGKCAILSDDAVSESTHLRWKFMPIESLRPILQDKRRPWRSCVLGGT